MMLVTVRMALMMGLMPLTIRMAAPVEHCLDLGLWQYGGVALLQRLLVVVHLMRVHQGHNRVGGDDEPDLDEKVDDDDDDDDDKVDEGTHKARKRVKVVVLALYKAVHYEPVNETLT